MKSAKTQTNRLITMRVWHRRNMQIWSKLFCTEHNIQAEHNLDKLNLENIYKLPSMPSKKLFWNSKFIT
jgi:hypothetical protein